MSPHAGIIRPLGPGDLTAALRLSDQAGWNQTAADWQRLLAWEPQGCFALDVDGHVAGTVTTTRYTARLAWVGMLLVDAALRRQGHGRRLMQHALGWLEQRGVGAVMLDATPLGQPLYVEFGFHHQYSLDRWQGIARRAGDPWRPLPPVDLSGLSPPLLALDRRAFGLNRARLLDALRGDPEARGFAAEHAGRGCGYLLLRPGAQRWHLGPVVATDDGIAARLLRTACATLEGQAVEIDVLRRPAVHAILRRLGLTPARPFLRMLRGGPAPAVDLPLIFATAGPEIG